MDAVAAVVRDESGTPSARKQASVQGMTETCQETQKSA